jgi:subtilisin family serine protease
MRSFGRTRARLLVGLGAGLLVLPIGAAAPASAEPVGLRYLDGARRVDVERLGPRAPAAGVVLEERLAPAAERGLAPVRLRYPDGREVRAEVDRTAIVELEPGAVEARLAELGVEPIRPLMPALGMWLVEDVTGGDGVDAAARMAGGHARALGVRRAAPNLYLHVSHRGGPWVPNDPRLAGQWYFKNLHMEDAWGLSRGDAKQTIVVVDTGCDMQHPDLKAKLDPGVNVVDGTDDPSPDPAQKDSAHGTACAGLVGAATDNGVGIAGGCPDCRVRCVKMLTDAPLPISKNVDAFQFAIKVDAAVVSNSWGFTDPTPVPQELADAINEVFDHGRGGKGALVLFAMGNDDRKIGNDELEAVRGVLGIGAVNNLDQSAPFTNFGDSVDLVAPTGTLSTDISGPNGFDPGDYTSLFGGTSSACPVAAGIAGLLVAVAPDKTSQELYDLLIKNARPAPYATPDAKGHDQVYGYGIIDPVPALKDALGIHDAGAGGAGAGGGGGAGGAHADVDAGADASVGQPASTPASSPVQQPGGCSCRTATRAPVGGAGLAAAALACAAALLRRARTRRAPRASSPRA